MWQRQKILNSHDFGKYLAVFILIDFSAKPVSGLASIQKKLNILPIIGILLAILS